MNVASPVTLLIVVIIGTSGCRPVSVEPAKKVTFSNRNSSGTPTDSGAASAAPTSSTGGLTAGGPAQPPAVPGASTTATSFPFRLSTGTALPQTGVDGTLMSFSIDYQVAVETLNKSSRYALVVNRATGNRFEQVVEFESAGTWSVVINRWRPEDGPFEAFVDEITADGEHRRVSRTVPLE